MLRVSFLLRGSVMKPILIACSFLLATAPLAAQSAPCERLNDVSTPVGGPITPFGFGGPGTRAYQFTPSTALFVQALEIYTANAFSAGFMTLDVFDEDPVTNLPGARIAGGTWQIDGAGTEAWQGTNLDFPAILTAGTPYWIVWTEPGGSVIPVDPAGTAVPSAWISGGAWTSLAATPFMLRAYCSFLDDQNVTPVGGPCASSVGLGTVFVNQAPTVGNAAFAIEATGLPPGTICWLVLGTNPNFQSIPVPLAGVQSTCMVYTDGLLDTLTGFAGTGNVRATAASGHVAFAAPIPSNPALVGFYVDAQLAAIDPGSTFPVPLVTSNGLRLTVF